MPIPSAGILYSILSVEGALFLKYRFDRIDQNADQRLRKAKRIIRDHAFISNALGLIPVPIIDIAGISISQLSMITRLAKLYDVPVKQELVKSVMGIVVHNLSSIGIYTLSTSLFKGMPIIGSMAGTVAVSAHATTITLLLGHLFLQHFESGGTLLTFDPYSVRKYFKRKMDNNPT